MLGDFLVAVTKYVMSTFEGGRVYCSLPQWGRCGGGLLHSVGVCSGIPHVSAEEVGLNVDSPSPILQLSCTSSVLHSPVHHQLGCQYSVLSTCGFFYTGVMVLGV